MQVAAAEAARAAAVERLQAAQLAAEQAGRRQDQQQQHMQVWPRRILMFAERPWHQLVAAECRRRSGCLEYLFWSDREQLHSWAAP